MEKDELYLPGWKHRRFFGARKRKENQAKKGKFDSANQIDDLIKEREKEEEEMRARHHQERQDGTGQSSATGGSPHGSTPA